MPTKTVPKAAVSISCQTKRYRTYTVRGLFKGLDGDVVRRMKDALMQARQDWCVQQYGDDLQIIPHDKITPLADATARRTIGEVLDNFGIIYRG